MNRKRKMNFWLLIEEQILIGYKKTKTQQIEMMIKTEVSLYFKGKETINKLFTCHS